MVGFEVFVTVNEIIARVSSNRYRTLLQRRRITMDQTTTTTAIQQHPPSNNTKQGFRFHKSGNISPIPPSSSSHNQTSQPQQLSSLSRSNSNSGDTGEGRDITLVPGEGRQQLQLPSNIDHKLYQIIKRITSNTPSLLVCSSGKFSRIFILFLSICIYNIYFLYQSQLYMFTLLTHHTI